MTVDGTVVAVLAWRRRHRGRWYYPWRPLPSALALTREATTVEPDDAAIEFRTGSAAFGGDRKRLRRPHAGPSGRRGDCRACRRRDDAVVASDRRDKQCGATAHCEDLLRSSKYHQVPPSPSRCWARVMSISNMNKLLLGNARTCAWNGIGRRSRERESAPAAVARCATAGSGRSASGDAELSQKILGAKGSGGCARVDAVGSPGRHG